MTEQGILYIVATPIGNLGDMTFRAIETLKKVNLIAAEDTRTTKKLLTHFGIETPLTSCFEHNESQKLVQLIERLQNGESIALVSEAGTPSVSDPGYRLVSEAVRVGIKLVPIPGAVAAVTALQVSGLPTDRFLFVGFLPDKPGKRTSKLEELKTRTETMIFYISKWKVEKVLQNILEVFGERRVCFCRELTKLHEDIRHTTLTQLIASVAGKQLKGEVTLVVEGYEISKMSA